MIARVLYYASFVAIAATVAIVGVRMWRDAHLRPAGVPIAVAIAPDGWLELAADRRTIARVTSTRARWTAHADADLDAITLAPPLVLALAPAALSAFELETGAARFTWPLPADETWAPLRPAIVGGCLLAITRHEGDAHVRCFDPARGDVRWTARIAGGHQCVQPALAVPGAFVIPCEGWTSIIDAKTGAASVDAGGRGVVQLDPPFLLRANPYLVVAPWFESEHRFAPQGDRVPGTTAFIALSAVRRWDRLIVRASSASDKLAVVSPAFGNPVVITSSELHLADDTPLVLACGGKAPPRFQLVDLAPLLGATFDPDLAQKRAYGLLDIVGSSLAWTSRAVVPVRHTAAAPICIGNHYFVALDLRTATNEIESALWILDAEAGTTTAVVAFDPDSGQSFGELTADQIDATRIIGLGPRGAFELPWSTPSSVGGLHDARADVERVLGPLP